MAQPEVQSRPIIDVRNLVKVYSKGRQDEVKAVDDVTFSVAEGEFFGFLGPNAAGKTTTIRIITTLLARTKGSVRVAGLDIDKEGTAIRRMIGYTGQSAGVDGDLTGRENLDFIGRLYHLPGNVIRERVEELLEVLQLTDSADRLAFTYSGGMRRRLDLGAGLMNHPRILFLDEPTTGLDPQTRNAVWEYLRKLHKDDGTTIFLTTQYMEEADRLCQRLAIIDFGKIVAEGSPEKLKAAIGSDVVTIRLQKDERFDENQKRALAAIEKVQGVKSVRPFDEGVSVQAENAGATLLEIARLLDADKIPLQEVALSRPTLDEVFIMHTGREMRPEEVRPVTRYMRGRR